MQNCTIGQVVYSKAGRDRGKMFVVVEVEDEYVYVADGKLRKIENPKKKKRKHIQITHTILDNLQEKINKGMKVSNSDIRKNLEDLIELVEECQELN
ncbi:MAG: RNA-binding protein [Epulopiscium sp.]|nr:RNA-binding protein [Candidatus Epulonipiscium sp.]